MAKTTTLYRVWMLGFDANPDRWIWFPVSRTFRSKQRAITWAGTLNVDETGWKIEEEEDDE